MATIEVKKSFISQRILLVFIPILLCLLFVDWFIPLDSSLWNFSTEFREKEIKNLTDQWEREETLDREGRIILKWNFTNEIITMMVVAQTKGYVGVGFSDNGTMINADIVIGWIAQGKVHLQDRFAVNESRPLLDEKQDYQILSGHQNGTHTTIIFQRNLNTCDQQDYVITKSTVKILWALNDKIPSEFQDDSIMYHGTSRGAINMNMLSLKPRKPSNEVLEEYDILIKDVELSYFGLSELSLVWYCQFYKIPNFGQKHQIIGFEPLVGRKDLVHHIVILECSATDLDVSFGTDTESPHYCYFPEYAHRESLCRKLIIAYGVGSTEDFYPPQVGYPFGSTEEKPMYLLMQVHYNFDSKIKGIRDTSGIRIYHTKNVRQHDLGVIIISPGIMQIIPPNESEFPNIGFCPSACTSDFPEEGIRIVKIGYHAHKAIRKFRLYHFRNNTEILRISDENMDFEFQQPKYFKDEVLILPNDTVAIECVYNTSGRRFSTVTGPDSNNEMCMLIIHYYPPVNLSYCQSFLQPKAVEEALGPPELNEVAESFAGVNALLLGYDIIGKTAKWLSYEWTKPKQMMARQLYLEGPQMPKCVSGSEPMVHKNDFIKFSDFHLKEPEDICKQHKTTGFQTVDI